MNTIHNNIKLLQKYVLFQLDEDKEFEIQEHLAGCDECSALVHQLRLVAQENRRLHEEWKKVTVPETKPVVKDYPTNARESGKVIPLRLVLRYAAVLLPILFLIGGGSGYLLNEKRLTELPSTNEVPSDDNQIEIVEVRKQFEDSIKVYADIIDNYRNESNTKKQAFEQVKSEKNELKAKLDQMTNCLSDDEYIPKSNASITQITEGPNLGDAAGSGKIDKNLVGNIHNAVFWEGEEITIKNRLGQNITVKIYSYSNNANLEIERTFSTDISIDDLANGIKYFSIYDDKNAFITGGKFWILPRTEPKH